MKKLLILNGLMGSGKSTFIKENKLEDFTLSSDELRIKMAGFDMSENGLVISQKKDRQVWAVLYTMLETRMEMGLFTVIDAMHLRTRDFKKYKELADLYGYEIYVKRFDNVALEELLERNKNRELYKRIPEDIIIKKYGVFINQVLPEYVTVIDNIEELYPQSENLDNYNNIKCIGDIHNNADKLEPIVEEIKGNQDTLYIFTGDIFDRGPKPYETMLLIGELLKLDNVRFIQGNHERHVRNYVYGTDNYSNQFKNTTLDKILERTQDTTILNDLVDRLEEFIYFRFRGETCFICHAGVGALPNNLLYLPGQNCEYGTGNYETEVDMLWEKNMTGITQVHGHRESTSTERSIRVDYSHDGRIGIYDLNTKQLTLK
jgi:2,3-cyclic nucleotide 3-phosphodiesterase